MTNRELAEILWQKKREEEKFLKTLDHYQRPRLGTAATTVFNLLQDDKDSPIYPYVCMEVLSRMQGDSPNYKCVLKDAIDAFDTLPLKGAPQYNIENLRAQYQKLNDRERYMSKISEDAENGIWSESVRHYIDGFDLINGKIGSFHDSKVLSISIDHEAETIDLTLAMCNGADCVVAIRFEDCTDYNINTDTLPVILYFGFFFEENGFLTLDLDPWGSISARHAKIISITSQ